MKAEVKATARAAFAVPSSFIPHPSSFISKRRQLLRSTGQRLLDEHRAMANAIGRLFLQAATARSETGERVIPNRRSTRDGLMAAIYAQVLKPYYVGTGEEPFAGTRPLSPYARLLYDGVSGMVRVEAEAQAALVRRLVSDEVVVDWLLSPYAPRRPVQEMSFSSFTQWLDPRGFRLTERIQRVAVEVRSRIGRFVDYHVGAGTPAPTMATKVEAFLTTGERGKTAYGNQGAVAPRVLAQHEMVKAGGDTVKATSAISPYVRGAQWLLSPLHFMTDNCDNLAEGGENGDGIYPLSELPAFPDHNNCQCHLRAVSVRNPAAVTAALSAAIGEGTEAAQALRGALNPERMTTEALTGTIQQTLDQVQAAPLSVPTAPQPAPVSTVALPSEQQRAAVLANVDAAIAEVAKEFGVTPATVEAGARRALAELTEGKQVAVQVYRDTLDKILDDGRFKTVFETNSKAIFDAEQRILAERQALGISRDTANRNRPVYGFVRSGPEADRYVRNYGDLTVVLKEGAKSRVTLTVDDSLRNGLAGEVAASPYRQLGKESWDNQVGTLYAYSRGELDQNEFFFITRYIEAQVQGGVAVGDIAAIVDRERVLSAAQRSRLAGLGIQVE